MKLTKKQLEKIVESYIAERASGMNVFTKVRGGTPGDYLLGLTGRGSGFSKGTGAGFSVAGGLGKAGKGVKSQQEETEQIGSYSQLERDYSNLPSRVEPNRILQLADQTGLPPSFIYAIERTESAHNPRAFAWNTHVYRKYSNDSEFYPNKKSVYKSEARSKFNEAYARNPKAAIKAGAWGLYQVLGATSLDQYNDDPEAFMSAWDSDPIDHSMKAFVRWVEKKDGFKEAVLAGDFTLAVKMYYGAPKKSYIQKVYDRVSEWETLTRPESVPVTSSLPNGILLAGDSQMDGALGRALESSVNSEVSIAKSGGSASWLASNSKFKSLLPEAIGGIVISIGGNDSGQGIDSLVSVISNLKPAGLNNLNVYIIGPPPAFKPMTDNPKGMYITRDNWREFWISRRETNEMMERVVESAGFTFINPYDYADGQLFNDDGSELTSKDGIHLEDSTAREFVSRFA